MDNIRPIIYSGIRFFSVIEVAMLIVVTSTTKIIIIIVTLYNKLLGDICELLKCKKQVSMNKITAQKRTETSRTLRSHAAQTEQMEYSMMQAISSVMQVMQSEMWLMT